MGLLCLVEPEDPSYLVAVVDPTFLVEQVDPSYLEAEVVPFGQEFLVFLEEQVEY